MPLKRWILRRVHGIAGRPDLRPPTEPTVGAPKHSPRPARPVPGAYDARDGGALAPEQLGPYAPLVAAIRDELAHFATTQLRLHLAIAERDRYLLTAIEVRCVDGSEGGELLQRFTREFTPEQVKRFIARGLIAQLPNAGAIDLSQFSGLNPPLDEAEAANAHDAYADLIAQLRASTPSEGPRSFEVRLGGRWTESDGAAVPAKAGPEAARTPLSGTPLDLAIDDARGTRPLSLPAVVPNRRYAVGKGERCDIVVDGAYASRRHCEIWLENGRWFAADAGSTNGIRIERPGAVNDPKARAPRGTVMEIPPGATLVLSALATGAPADYPRLRLQLREEAPPTPVAPVVLQAASTPVTPIAAPARTPSLALVATMASGTRTIPLAEEALPLRVGRSRNQDLVVDWSHEGVSGRHIEIAQFDAHGADVEVHGDNGVTVGGTTHEPGRRFRWRVGETMTLGRASGDEPECRLALQREPRDD